MERIRASATRARTPPATAAEAQRWRSIAARIANARTLIAAARKAAPKAKPAAPERSLEAMPLHSPIERRPGQAQRHLRVADIAFIEFQRPRDRPLFQLVEVQGFAGGPPL